MEARQRMQDYRLRLKKQGLRPVQIWVPDQRQAGFDREIKKQIRRLDPADEAEALDFIARVADGLPE